MAAGIMIVIIIVCPISSTGSRKCGCQASRHRRGVKPRRGDRQAERQEQQLLRALLTPAPQARVLCPLGPSSLPQPEACTPARGQAVVGSRVGGLTHTSCPQPKARLGTWRPPSYHPRPHLHLPAFATDQGIRCLGCTSCLLAGLLVPRADL